MMQDVSVTQDWKQWEGLMVDGKYRLGHFLGGSEHSAVFLTATTGTAAQPAAIKLVPADSGTAELPLSRWRQTAAVSHPHLLRLFDMGQCDLGGRPLLYLIMEYAPEDLAQILPQRPLTPAEVREMLPPVLDALAFLHGQSLVHGHLKPGNILAIGDQIKLSSDGIGAAGDLASGEPSAYDPPEAAGGFPAADMWALGVTLVQALTQQKPSRDRGLPGAPVLAESLPAPFREIARQCLATDPQRRASAAEIAAQLRSAPAPTPIPAVTRPEAPAFRRYLVPVLVAALVVAIVLSARLFRRAPEARIINARESLKVQTQKKPSARVARPAPKPVNDRQPGAAPAIPKPSPAKQATGGAVLRQVLPDVSQGARNTIRGTVRVMVRVKVDASGDVAGADFDSRGPSRYFARLAMDAARQWKFEPPAANGQKTASVWVLRFEFRRNGTRAVPARAS